jgi:hypothetical protein
MEDNKYQRSKIYKIISPHTDKIYIGSTTEIYLSQRLTKAKNMYKRFLENKHHYVSSYELFKLGDVEIILIETYPCNSKDELHKKEREYIELNKEITVNKNIPSRKSKEYYQDNKDFMLDKANKYYENNKDKIREKQNSWSLLKYKCVCGGDFTNGNKSHHINTDKHQTYELIQTL